MPFIERRAFITRAKPMKKTHYDVTLRRTSTGDVHTRLIIADDEAAARELAVKKARNAKGATMAERSYEAYEVVSCDRQRGTS
jgi:hypothetical protein